MFKTSKTITSSTLALVAGCFLIPNITNAAGFALKEVSSSLMGASFAAASTYSDDISGISFNPATLGLFKGTSVYGTASLLQSDGGLHDITADPGGPLAGLPVETRPFEENTGGDEFVPASYFATDLTDNIRFGLSVTAPFGLSTSYSENYPGRFHGTHSELRGININPVLSYNFRDKLIVAAGVQLFDVRTKLTNSVFVSPLLNFGYSEVQGNGWGTGASFGVIYKPHACTTLGLGFQSAVKITAKGSTNITSAGPTSIAPLSGKVEGTVTFPEKLNFGFTHSFTPSWSVSADVQWTRWSRFKTLDFFTTTSSALPGIPAGTVLVSTVDEDWQNVFYYAVGTQYSWKKLKFRLGLGFDESPIPDATRTPRIPGNDRWLLGTGITYEINKMFTADIGYLHVFIKDADLRLDQFGNNFRRGTLTALGQANVDIVSIGMNVKF